EPEAPLVVPRAPRVQFTLPTREASTPRPITAGNPKFAKSLAQTRATLRKLVDTYGRNPQSPWAIAHAMLALGPEMDVPGFEGSAVDFLAENYGQPHTVGTDELWTFPPRVGQQLVDVHTDLLLKAFTEGGLSPDRKVTVRGKETTLGELYRRSLYRAWVDLETGRTGYMDRAFNDAPWSLQALTAWAPTHLQYMAEGDHPMRLQDLTRGLRETIARETKVMKQARDAGKFIQKDARKGFFRYTCGGQHMLQGLTYAVARGFGNAADKHEVCEQIELLRWRTDLELQTVDPIIEQGTPDIQILLNVQRLKYLGHNLETVHKAAAMGVCELTDPQVAASQRVARELVRTVQDLGTLGAFGDLSIIARDPRYARMRQGGGAQVVLDLIGDSAHAIRGIDMATGEGVIRY
ncbi:MAG: hypothetical protein AAF602_13665, partial [Myxococcota bacterium]